MQQARIFRKGVWCQQSQPHSCPGPHRVDAGDGGRGEVRGDAAVQCAQQPDEGLLRPAGARAAVRFRRGDVVGGHLPHVPEPPNDAPRRASGAHARVRDSHGEGGAVERVCAKGGARRCARSTGHGRERTWALPSPGGSGACQWKHHGECLEGTRAVGWRAASGVSVGVIWGGRSLVTWREGRCAMVPTPVGRR